MLTNPFDSPNDAYLIVVNAEDQHALWPDLVALPEGWTPVFGPEDRTVCLDHVATLWTDLRPASVRRFLADDPATP
ncbi:MbtH family protein [Actinocorallia sp. A-T 12471]|uniref:MbtH family protein n=1 Tax=Actinocorallia sp. A-T 12471 TaxID=3089813 RepID=UPI0029D3BA81|nr:MbtH family NRPS accessory protein [Actinocorallia sp. A-T 12471]MDX6741629.1 MbtH family NRPS accessory protein [Actinocorallia sp. A-T 12471]